MKNLPKIALSLIAAGVFAHANASTINVSTAYLNDGVALDVKSSELWWAGNDNSSSLLLAGSSILSEGNHTLSIDGLENCCDGGQQVQFAADNSNFASFSSADGPVPDLSEPSSYAMLLTSLALLGFTARRRQDDKF
ncbi:CCXG family PEP-CTERM protein [Janthinobacterium lividum]|uniref:CCXG family PEP-CTERM protein n=1 Tax=Janthinobacterium sp. LB2P49 TaxID=3424198 RepID=UPI0021870B7D|nr:CCXG family PEP-CTERM protein [Janthinobacterium lividum]